MIPDEQVTCLADMVIFRPLARYIFGVEFLPDSSYTCIEMHYGLRTSDRPIQKPGQPCHRWRLRTIMEHFFPAMTLNPQQGPRTLLIRR